MTGGQAMRADLTSHAQQRIKLYVGVAIGAGDRGAAGEILIYEWADYASFELVFEIHYVMGEIEMLGDAPGVVDIVDGAATMLLWAAGLQLRKTTLVPELHGQADDGAILFLKESSHDGAVNTTAHGDGDAAGTGRCGALVGTMVLDGLERGGHVRKLI